MTRVYMDGVFDLFHRGHIEAIKKCLEFGDELVIGVVSDKDCASYKRQPVINEIDRLEILKNIKGVKEIIFPSPLTVDEKFISDNKLDLIVHAFADKADFEKQKKFYKIPISLNKFKYINYYDKTSTTNIINKIKNS